MTTKIEEYQYGKNSDGCQWHPKGGRPSEAGDGHFIRVAAQIVVGSKGEWRLCEECSQLPVFKRYRTRKQIT